MIIIFLSTWLIGWSLGMVLRRAATTTPATPVAPPEQRGAGISPPAGLEDDPARRPAARGDWTALDERQLTRLLTDSAT